MNFTFLSLKLKKKQKKNWNENYLNQNRREFTTEWAKEQNKKGNIKIIFNRVNMCVDWSNECKLLRECVSHKLKEKEGNKVIECQWRVRCGDKCVCVISHLRLEYDKNNLFFPFVLWILLNDEHTKPPNSEKT